MALRDGGRRESVTVLLSVEPLGVVGVCVGDNEEEAYGESGAVEEMCSESVYDELGCKPTGMGGDKLGVGVGVEPREGIGERSEEDLQPEFLSKTILLCSLKSSVRSIVSSVGRGGRTGLEKL